MSQASDTHAEPPVAESVSYAVGCVLGRWDVRFATGEKAMNFRRSAAGKPRAWAIPSPSRNETAAEDAMELECATPTFHHPSLAHPGKMKQPFPVGRSLRA